MYDQLLKKCNPTDCLFLTYEDLTENVSRELQRVIIFLGQEFTGNIKKCILQESDGRFKSPRRDKKELDVIYKTISKEKIGLNLKSMYKSYVKRFTKRCA